MKFTWASVDSRLHASPSSSSSTHSVHTWVRTLLRLHSSPLLRGLSSVEGARLYLHAPPRRRLSRSVAMDILFSPYGVGGLPKSAIAEIERRTEDLLKSSSFQRMLELEKKYKVCAPPPASPLACWLGPCLDCFLHVLHGGMSLTMRSHPTDGPITRPSTSSALLSCSGPAQRQPAPKT